MQKPISRPSDENQRRLVVEPFEVEWSVDGVRYRAHIEPWGASYEPSVPRLWPWVNFPMLALLVIAAWTGSLYLWAPVAVWLVLMAPSILIGSLAPREALSPVSAAHDYFYRNQGDVPFWTYEEDLGTWSTGRNVSRPGMSYQEGDNVRLELARREADAVMLADEDDPTWLQYAAWAWTRLLGWWMWYDLEGKIWNWFSNREEEVAA